MKQCSIAGCERKVTARGFCQLHYFRWWAHGSPHTVLRKPRIINRKECSVDGCTELETTRGMCHRHYMAWYHRGGLDKLRVKPSRVKRDLISAHKHRAASGEVWV